MAAGAVAASRLRCPSGEPVTDAVFCTRLFEEYSDGALLVGPFATDFPADLRIFVGTPTVDTLQPEPPPAPRRPAAADDIQFLQELLIGQLLSHATPFGPAFVPPFAAAADADLLVLDACDDEGRRRAAALGEEFEAQRRAMLRSRPRKAHVVNLADPKDAGTKLLLAIVKRALRGRQRESD